MTSAPSIQKRTRERLATKKQREYEQRLKELTVSAIKLPSGAIFYKLKAASADGAEYAESWQWQNL